MPLVIPSFLIPPFAQRTRKGWGTRHTNIPVAFGWFTVLIFCLGILHSRWDDDLHGQLFVDGRDKVPAAAVVEDADHGFLFALHHADDPAFSATVMPEATQFYQHLVAMHGVADLWRRNKYVALELALGAGGKRAGFGDDEAEAIAVHT